MDLCGLIQTINNIAIRFCKTIAIGRVVTHSPPAGASDPGSTPGVSLALVGHLSLHHLMVGKLEYQLT